MMISIRSCPCAGEGNLGVWAFRVFGLKSNGIMSLADEFMVCGIADGERNEGHACKYPDVILLRGSPLGVLVPVYWRHTRNKVGIGGRRC